MSVFIPYYRGAPVIREAVGSALAQSLAPDEIVICDDGSPDDLELALGDLVPQVRIVRQENRGVGVAPI
jgi:glycosyltransferase involved in cell wall biosynthesis